MKERTRGAEELLRRHEEHKKAEAAEQGLENAKYWLQHN